VLIAPLWLKLRISCSCQFQQSAIGKSNIAN